MSKEADQIYAFLVRWHAADCMSGRRDKDMTIYHTYDRLAQDIADKFDVKPKVAHTQGQGT